jgi:hypothetical protein
MTPDDDEPPPSAAVKATVQPLSRRQMLARTGAAFGGGVLALRATRADAADVPGAERPRSRSAAATKQEHADQRALPPGRPGRDYQPVVVPNGTRAPWTIVGGVKVFHLVAEEVQHEFAPGLKATCWGYNGSVHGPLLEWVEGERVRIYVTNRLEAPTTVHWHGILLPNGMDGVGGATGARAIETQAGMRTRAAPWRRSQTRKSCAETASTPTRRRRLNVGATPERGAQGPTSEPQSRAARRRSALAITDTELNAIAALASIGLSSSPNSG